MGSTALIVRDAFGTWPLVGEIVGVPVIGLGAWLADGARRSRGRNAFFVAFVLVMTGAALSFLVLPRMALDLYVIGHEVALAVAILGGVAVWKLMDRRRED